jgi:hypothetical protein
VGFGLITGFRFEGWVSVVGFVMDMSHVRGNRGFRFKGGVSV